MEKYIQIKDKIIPIVIRSYKTSKTIKLFFKKNILNVTKPTRCNYKEIEKIIRTNEEKLYNQYIKQCIIEDSDIKRWKTGEKISYKGNDFNIIRREEDVNSFKIYLEEKDKILNIVIPKGVDEENIKKVIDNMIKKIFKNNTKIMLEERIPYWSKITNIKYNTFKVRDTVSKYGSCVPKTKVLHFSSRLIMLPENVIDAIIVHELCHIIHGNHSKDFYNLLETYIPNYNEIRKWLKQNNNIIKM